MPGSKRTPELKSISSNNSHVRSVVGIGVDRALDTVFRDMNFYAGVVDGIQGDGTADAKVEVGIQIARTTDAGAGVFVFEIKKI